ncbi:alpha-(1-_3)-arabinofuranosyltransferase family protein [Nocardioides sp. SYSU D00038]|uniref:alpha-(1->3)-arabinofuranosyltransferase domain-containing protein n=1 Tax=Nocardioides sp. SYSU D00038 TaxID=2812554 RepID=UPI0019689337|nr:alpha-(1->3)-arabinofuranosyltransferase family protein [Nocardioides sp. SYSU D00038]
MDTRRGARGAGPGERHGAGPRDPGRPDEPADHADHAAHADHADHAAHADLDDQAADRAARRADRRRAAVLTWTAYLVLAMFVVTEKFGQTTSDTRLDMTEAPTQFLRDTFSLWNPRVSLGELQNQAYGYLFPQGLFFSGMEQLAVPGWVAERVWSVLVLVVACEGLRRVALVLAVNPWAAAVAGLAYGLNARNVAELGVRSAEILPGAVLPWALLPVLIAVRGRLGAPTAAVLSAAAFACSGGVNGTATAAPAALLAVFVVWAWATRRLGWRFVLGWGAAMVVVNAWWALSLARLGEYSPPFFDYVEDARSTTRSSGFTAALRAASNWVDYIVVNGRQWWPAGWDVSYNPWIALAGGVVAALGVVGLARCRGEFRVPLALSAALGITCLSIAHVGTLDGPLSEVLRDLLDGPLAPLRNVPKADPVLRLPLCVGLGLLVGELGRAVVHGGRRWGRDLASARRVGAGALTGATVLGLVVMAWPVLSANLRTPGWDEVPDHWLATAAYLDDSEADGAAWIVPGSGFGIQTWGWTMEEPMQVLGSSPWVTRSQVPLTPAPTIRMLSALEEYLGTGAGSPYLRNMLERIGVDRVVVRHDLDPEVSQATPSILVAIALARSPGITRVATFGRLEFGPAIEVFEVENAYGGRPDGAPGFDVRDADEAVTVATSVEDAITGVGAGLVGDDQAMVVQGETGWEEPARLQGDGFRRRERAFGRVHDAESNVMTADDPYRGGRVVPNYPGPDGADPVVAHYRGIDGVTASSSSGYADILGGVRPETAPWSVLDGDDDSYWVPGAFQRPRGQWVEVDLGVPRSLGEVVLQEPVQTLGLQPVEEWRVTAGGETVDVEPRGLTGRAVADLGGVRADRVRVEVRRVGDPTSPVGLAELAIEGVEPERTLRLPDVEQAGPTDLLFAAVPESRACITTLLGPDCDPGRHRASEEATGIDRTFHLDASGTWRPRGLAVARSTGDTLELLKPVLAVQASASSWLERDPTVSPRMAHDDDPTTSWVADPRDPTPTLTLDLGTPRTFDRIVVDRPAPVAARPTRAVLRTEDGAVRTVDLTGTGRFEPVRASRVEITFARPGDDPFTLGVGEVRLRPGRVAVPLEGAATTGAVCGFGPQLEIDGRRYPTRVRGPLGAVTANGQLAVKLCGPSLELEEGEHRVRLLSTPQFQPVALTLRAIADRPAVARSRLLVERSTSDTRHVLEVGPGEDAILSTPQSFNAGWVARAGDRVLEPLQVDGWSQGWRLPADVSGRVVLTFDPQPGYLRTLVAGLVVLGLVLLAALVLLLRLAVRRRRDLPLGPGPRVRPAARALPRWVALVGSAGAVAAGFVVGGPVVAAGALAGVALVRVPRLGELGATALLLAGLLVFVLQVAPDDGLPTATSDLLTGAGLALALTLALAPRPSRRFGSHAS